MCSKRAGLATVLLVLLVNALAQDLHAMPTVLFDTAGDGATTQGVGASDDFWTFHRFEVTAPTRLVTVGGVFGNTSGVAIDIFGAVVRLSSPTDLPDSLDLTTPGLLGTTLLSVSPTAFQESIEVEAPIDLILEPGWHALGFGTGAFGSPSGTNGVIMADHNTDLAPNQLPFTAVQDPNNHNFGFVRQNIEPRFFGTALPINAIPEPITATAGMMSLFALGYSVRRRAMTAGSC